MAGHMFTDGENLTAEKTNQYLNHSIIEPVPYEPIVDNASATAVGEYVRIGRLIVANFHVTFTGAGGGLRVSVPEQMDGAVYGLDLTTAIGTAVAFTSTPSNTRRAMTVLAANATRMAFLVDSTSALVTAAAPWTWASGDRLRGTVTYFAAE